ncbi:MAG: acyltransferase family protein [Pseudomonadota bacterium]
MSIRYRADIDGLRALAVCSVILFHIDPSWLPGGFTGVDIFFVISGYLITSIMLSDIDAGQFSFADFFARRLKRIIPVLSVVIISVSILFHFIFTPADLENLSRSALASQFFLANFYFTFFSDTSYFADNAHSEPFLHLWSLGVEEQFYLIWPFALIFLVKRISASQLIAIMFALTLISFALGDALYAIDPDVAYYMLPTRICQFGSGIIVALVLTRGVFTDLNQNRIVGNVLVISGCALIFWSFWWLAPESPFPGWRAAPPTIGAALIIFGGACDPQLSRAFSLPPVVRIGRISYSAYLWHWPVIVIFLYLQGELSLTSKLTAIIVTFALAGISYTLVEQPFRKRTYGFKTSFIRMFAVPSAVIATISLLVIITNGFGVYAISISFKNDVYKLSTYTAPNFRADYICQKSELISADLDNPKCVTGVPDAEPTIILWGDSKAAQYAGLIGAVAKDIDLSVRNFAHSACPPVLVTPQKFTRGRYVRTCETSSAVVRDKIETAQRLIISASWALYFRANEEEFEHALRETLSILQQNNIDVLLVGDIPRQRRYDRECYTIRLKTSLANCADRSRTPRGPVRSYNRRVEDIAKQAGVHYVDFDDLLCDNNYCFGELSGNPLYYDGGHLSVGGSIALGHEVLKNPTQYEDFLAWLEN